MLINCSEDADRVAFGLSEKILILYVRSTSVFRVLNGHQSNFKH